MVGATSSSAPPSRSGAAEVFVNEVEGDGVGGVRGVRLAGGGVDHLLAVAVIGGDKERAARRPNALS